MRRAALRLALILAASVAMGAIGACGAEGSDGEDAGDASTPDTSVKDATADHTIKDAKEAAVSDAKIDSPIPDADAKTGDASDASDAADAIDAKDAALDTGLPPQGSPCTPSGAVQAQGCGVCGVQERVCLDLGDGTKWQSWGSCKSEVVGGCVPGTTAFEACDLCGRRRQECTTACTWITGICENQNPNACEPSLVDWVGELSCATGTGRTRTCSPIDLDASVDAAQTGCTWGNYASTCTPPPKSADIPVTAGEQIGVSITLGTDTMPYVYGNTFFTDAGGCGVYPSTTIPSYMVPYAYFELVNPTSKNATVSVWATLAADSGTGDGLRITAYPGSANPPTSLTNCLSADSCYSTTCKLDAGFGLTADGGTAANDAGTLAPYYSPKVTIPAGGKIVLLVSESFNSYPYTSLPSLWVRTDELK